MIGLQILASGILLGGIYALISVGLNLIFGVIKVVNMAHGDFLMLGMYAAYFLFTGLAISPYVSAIIIFPVFMVIGYVVFRLVVKPLLGKAETETNTILATSGLQFVLQNLVLMLFTADYRAIQLEGGATSFNIGGVMLSANRTWAFLICLILAYPLAMMLSNMKVSQTSFMVLIFILPMWMNFLLRTMAWQTLLEKNGVINQILSFCHLPSIQIINTPGAIILGMVYNFLPFMVLPLYNVLSKIDRDIILAARDLGATPVYTFRKIIFPLSLPGVISGITMVFVPALTTFVISDLLGGSKILLIGEGGMF